MNQAPPLVDAGPQITLKSPQINWRSWREAHQMFLKLSAPLFPLTNRFNKADHLAAGREGAREVSELPLHNAQVAL